MSKPRTKSQPGKEAKDRDRLSKFTEAIRQYSDFSEFLSSDTMPLMTALEQYINLHKRLPSEFPLQIRSIASSNYPLCASFSTTARPHNSALRSECSRGSGRERDPVPAHAPGDGTRHTREVNLSTCQSSPSGIV